MDPKIRIAVVGGSGVVGQELLSGLLDRGFPAEQLTILGSERSEGSEVEYGEESLEIERATPESFRGISLALFATPADASKKLAPAAQAAGAWVVDASSAFRGDGAVPLALPLFSKLGIQPQRGRIVRTPSSLAAAMVLALEPLRKRFGIAQVEGTALVAASSAGERGVAELEKQSAALLSGGAPESAIFPYRIGFNLIPQVGAIDARGWSEEERWLIDDVRELWGEGNRGVAVGVTAVQVPIFFGHALSLAVRLRSPASAEAVRDALRGQEAVKLLDEPMQRIYPLTMTVTADTAVHVGRIRSVPEAPEWVQLYLVIDNAGRGAALNAIEAGEVLLGTSLGEEGGAAADDDEEDSDEEGDDELATASGEDDASDEGEGEDDDEDASGPSKV